MSRFHFSPRLNEGNEDEPNRQIFPPPQSSNSPGLPCTRSSPCSTPPPKRPRGRPRKTTTVTTLVPYRYHFLIHYFQTGRKYLRLIQLLINWYETNIVASRLRVLHSYLLVDVLYITMIASQAKATRKRGWGGREGKEKARQGQPCDEG